MHAQSCLRFWYEDRNPGISSTTRMCEVESTVLTRLAELRCASASSRDDGDHFGTQAGSPLLAACSNGPHSSVGLAAVIVLQCVHLSTDTGTLDDGSP